MAAANKLSELNARAQNGFAKSSLYDQHRPAYSATVVQYLLEQLRVADKKHATIVDLAAGTGKFTEALAARHEDFRIIAVEPHEQMRQVLESKKLKGVTVVDGMSDNMPTLQGGSVDAVTVAQVCYPQYSYLFVNCELSACRAFIGLPTWSRSEK